jgi:Zn-finger nucleic acid-binding protein
METLTLTPPRRDEVDLDACARCGALWFDRGELERSSQRKVTRRETTEQIDAKCPRCRERLYADQLGDGNWVYGCEKCSGVLVEGDTVRASLKLHPPQKQTPGLFDELGGLCPKCGRWSPGVSQNPSPHERCGRCLDRRTDGAVLELTFDLQAWLDRL